MDVNAWATGIHCAGKTPLFFSLTRCRDDIVLVLLEMGATARIVNNKGQTPLSLAASHLRDSTVQAIAAHEASDTRAWLNFRSTHSDGLVYGDLDPRFLPSPPTSEDVVQPLVVNPTTRASREARRLQCHEEASYAREATLAAAATAAAAAERDLSPGSSLVRCAGNASALLPSLEAILEAVEMVLRSDSQVDEIKTVLDAMIMAYDAKRAPYIAHLVAWIGSAVQVHPRCRIILTDIASDDADGSIVGDGAHRRVSRIRQKILRRALGLPSLKAIVPMPLIEAAGRTRIDVRREMKRADMPNAVTVAAGAPVPIGTGAEDTATLKALTLQDGKSKVGWVDTAASVYEMRRILLQLADSRQGGAPLVVALDTEWTCTSPARPSSNPGELGSRADVGLSAMRPSVVRCKGANNRESRGDSDFAVGGDGGDITAGGKHTPCLRMRPTTSLAIVQIAAAERVWCCDALVAEEVLHHLQDSLRDIFSQVCAGQCELYDCASGLWTALSHGTACPGTSPPHTHTHKMLKKWQMWFIHHR